MNQSNFIFFALLLAFIVYVTMRGELPTYMGFFVPNPNAGSTGAQGSTGAAGTPGAAQQPSGPGFFSPLDPNYKNGGANIPQSSPLPNQPGTAPAIGGGSTPIVPSLSPFNLPGF